MFSFLATLNFDIQTLNLITLVQRYVSTILEVSTTFLFGEIRRY